MNSKYRRFLCILMLIAPIAALKLTPVQQQTQRIDLANESKNILMALNNAIRRTQHYDPMTDLMMSAEFLNLHTIIKRWSYIEEKLRSAILPGSLQQVKFFFLTSYLLLINFFPLSSKCLRTSFTILPQGRY
jgi:hypothetical protein